MPSNELYLTVLPLMHLPAGMTEQAVTLFPDKEFATRFYPDEVDGYILFFQRRADNYLTGGHVAGYECVKESTEDGRVIVRVIQNVG